MLPINASLIDRLLALTPNITINFLLIYYNYLLCALYSMISSTPSSYSNICLYANDNDVSEVSEFHPFFEKVEIVLVRTATFGKRACYKKILAASAADEILFDLVLTIEMMAAI